MAVIERRLVVNGDDFGLTPGVNAGILDAHEHGILTSASLFANAGATAAALRIARRTPTLGVGVHLTIVDGTPTLSAASLPTLAPGGAFRPTWRALIEALLARRVALDEIERELAAQIDRVRSGGVALTHLDGHKHVHAYPPVFAIVLKLARRFAIPVVRVPCERRPLRLVASYATARGARRQALENLALAPWGWRDRRLMARAGLPPAPHFLGRALTGFMSRDRLTAAIASLRRGTSELMTHPGYPDAALDRIRTRLREERATEVALLTDPAIRAAVRAAGVVLVRHDGIPVSEQPHHATQA